MWLNENYYTPKAFVLHSLLLLLIITYYILNNCVNFYNNNYKGYKFLCQWNNEILYKKEYHL